MPDTGGPVNIGGIISAIGAFFGFLGSSISDALRRTIDALKAGLSLLARLARDLFTLVYYGLRDLFAGVIRPLFLRLKAWATWLRDHLANLTRPIIEWIKRVQAVLRDIFRAYIRPVLEAIALLREFLALTRLNQTTFGAALDTELAKLSNEISGKFLLIETTFNGFATRFEDLVSRVDKILSIPVLITNLFTQIGALATAFWNDQIKQVSVSGRLILVDLKLKEPLATKKETLKTFTKTTRGDLLPAILLNTDRAMRVARGESPDWLDFPQ